MPRIAQVVVDIANTQVDRVFDYRIDDHSNYICPGYRVLVPFGHRTIEGFVVSVSDHTQIASDKLKPIVRTLEDYPALTKHQVELVFWLQSTYSCLLADALRVMLPAQMRGGRVKKKTERYYHLDQENIDLDQILNGLKRAKRQSQIVNLLARQNDSMKRSDILDQLGSCESALKSLVDKKIIVESEKRTYRRPNAGLDNHIDRIVDLNADQHYAVNEILKAERLHHQHFLIHGVTGSGKTEVYMRATAEAVRDGKTVIILVPEISLTPQMVARFTARFGRSAAVLHSKLSAGERFDEWQRIRDGQARIVIGARSAIFAPLENIGLIVIDEEHENTYRSETPPRYDTIEVAKKRCEQDNAVLVLGSATPTIQRYYEARQGMYHLLEMPDRVGTAMMPNTYIVDMRIELKNGNKSMISQRLYQAMEKCLNNGEKMILFLNRRGHSTFVSCRDCGYVCSCEYCEIPMTYHMHTHDLRCHYCGREIAPPVVCPECGSRHIRYFGGGTQKLQQAVEDLFPGAKVLRMDADTTTRKTAHLDILNAFSKDDAQILIGTQMITKGLDFDNVTLVGVIAADASLYVSDYKAAERTFQLTAQVAGRSGRGALRGNVIIQTYSPDNYAIVNASKHDYQGFYQEEIQLRKMALFPPFGAFSRWVFSHEDEKAAQYEAEQAMHRMRAYVDADVVRTQSLIHLDVSPAQLARLRGRYRYQLIMKYYPNQYGQQLLKVFSQLGEDAMGLAHMALEINPVNML